MARDNLLIYPDFNEGFKIHTNASAFQLWAVVSQKDKPITFYGRKLTGAQQWYIVTERELPSIVESLKAFRTILLGLKLKIYTDHKNLTCTFLNTNRVLIYILILKEYGPDIEYIRSDKNIVSDTLSRLPLNRNQETTQKFTYQK